MSVQLNEMMKILVANLSKEEVRLPFKDQKPWHLLFYSLKIQQTQPGRPSFLNDLIFDWDGPYPKCEELADFLNALHVTANVSALNPHYEVITVDKDDEARWSQQLSSLDTDARTFVTAAVDLARQQFQAVAA